METTTPKRKVSNLHVRSIEDEILLIQESEARGGEMSAEEAYIK